MRALATIRRIDKLEPIEGADAIMLAKIDGWQCVVKKDEFKEGDQCVYFEIDSLIPMMPEVEHLRARAFKRIGDKEGIRVKTIRLREQLSQGLALPIMESLRQQIGNCTGPNDFMVPQVGMDVTDMLGVSLYELPVPPELEGVTGNFPSHTPRTRQERCQNIGYKILTENADSRYEVSMKLNGTSFTGFNKDGKAGVCGRRWELDINDPENAKNDYVRMFVDSGLQKALEAYGRNISVQGELMGPAHALPNPEKFKFCKLFVFDIFDNDKYEYLGSEERHRVFAELMSLGINPELVFHVPVLHTNVTLAELGITSLPELLAFADGPSIVHHTREGLVFKSMDGKFTFKVISNRYLLKEEQ